MKAGVMTPAFIHSSQLWAAFGGGVAVHQTDAALEIRAAAQGVTTVDAEDLTGDPPALGTTQVTDGGGDVVDGAEPADRHLAQVVGSDLVAGDQRRGQIGGHEPRP